MFTGRPQKRPFSQCWALCIMAQFGYQPGIGVRTLQGMKFGDTLFDIWTSSSVLSCVRI
jgi:hypothetical protein